MDNRKKIYDVLDGIAAGTLTPEEAAPVVVEIMRSEARPPARDWLEREERAQEDKPTAAATILQAAHIRGRIGDDDYKALMAGVYKAFG